MYVQTNGYTQDYMGTQFLSLILMMFVVRVDVTVGFWEYY